MTAGKQERGIAIHVHDGNKWCKKCKINKHKKQFSKDRRAKDGLKSQCKECDKQYAKLQRAKNARDRKQNPCVDPRRDSKTCSACKGYMRIFEDDATQNFSHQNGSKDGFYGQCKACANESNNIQSAARSQHWQEHTRKQDCADCEKKGSEDDNHLAFQFEHPTEDECIARGLPYTPKSKDYTGMSSMSIERQEEELKKPHDIVCGICHCFRTDARRTRAKLAAGDDAPPPPRLTVAKMKAKQKTEDYKVEQIQHGCAICKKFKERWLKCLGCIHLDHVDAKTKNIIPGHPELPTHRADGKPIHPSQLWQYKEWQNLDLLEIELKKTRALCVDCDLKQTWVEMQPGGSIHQKKADLKTQTRRARAPGPPCRLGGAGRSCSSSC